MVVSPSAVTDQRAYASIGGINEIPSNFGRNSKRAAVECERSVIVRSVRAIRPNS